METSDAVTVMTGVKRLKCITDLIASLALRTFRVFQTNHCRKNILGKQ